MPRSDPAAAWAGGTPTAREPAGDAGSPHGPVATDQAHAAPIPQMAPLAFEQIIIAGGDDDVTAVDLFDWVAPLLAGIPGGRWMSCLIDFDQHGNMLASYRDGCNPTMVCVRLDAASPSAADLAGHLPESDSLAVILLNDFSSQAVTLLDGVARWLNIYDTDEGSLAPVLRLMGGFQNLLAKA